MADEEKPLAQQLLAKVIVNAEIREGFGGYTVILGLNDGQQLTITDARAVGLASYREARQTP